jgi:glycine cleavage system transcriptional repressor
VGADRPGLVSGLSTLIHDRGANIEDSRMAVLGGEFAIVLLFSGTADAVTQVEAASGEVADSLGLTLFFRQTEIGLPTKSLAYRLQVSGMDHPGIVQRVTDVLSGFEINVAALDTSVVHAPMSGTPTFLLRADVEIPADVSVRKTREALQAACEADNLDCILEPRV